MAPEQYLPGASFVNFEHNFVLCSTVIIDEFKQINVVWVWETLVSDRFVFINCEKYIVLRAVKICWAMCFHKVVKG